MSMLLRKFSNNLTAQVVLALLLGATVGALWPGIGASMQMLSDIFIKLIKMVIPPIAFLTIVIGIAEVRDLRRLGRVGGQALIYFEVASTIALIVGLIVMNVLKPGASFDRAAVGSQAIDISKYKAAPVGS
ncbi:Na+/H+-dicarboxylate symporter [Bradyrhizobium sp. USDA 4452]